MTAPKLADWLLQRKLTAANETIARQRKELARFHALLAEEKEIVRTLRAELLAARRAAKRIGKAPELAAPQIDNEGISGPTT